MIALRRIGGYADDGNVGVLIMRPEIGRPMTLYRRGSDGGLQRIVTSAVTRIFVGAAATFVQTRNNVYCFSEAPLTA